MFKFWSIDRFIVKCSLHTTIKTICKWLSFITIYVDSENISDIRENLTEVLIKTTELDFKASRSTSN